MGKGKRMMTEEEFRKLQRENMEIDRSPKVTKGPARPDSLVIFKPSQEGADIEPVRTLPGFNPLALLQPGADPAPLALRPSDATGEALSASDRADATTQRTAVLVLVLGGATFIFIAIELLAGAPFWLIALTMAGFPVASVYGYTRLSKLDYVFSAPGVEHHKIDATERLAAQKLKQEHELKKQALQAYLDMLKGGNG